MQQNHDTKPTSLLLATDFGEKRIVFQQPNNLQEYDQMFRQRASVYSSKNYFIDNRVVYDIDEHDKAERCAYFLAKIDNILVGSVRLIFDDTLPTEVYFDFDEPDEINKIPRNRRTEISRLVVQRHDFDFLPKNLVTLFLIRQILKYAEINEIYGGYAFVKQRLLHKLNKLQFPIHKIKAREQCYPNDGILYNYFNDPEDPVLPSFFLTQETKTYIEKNLRHRRLFEEVSENTLRLKSNFYTAFLKKLRII